MTKRIMVGGVAIGGGAPVTIQSMTNTKTADVVSTCAQIAQLGDAGCDIVRVAVPDMASAEAISQIKSRIRIPLVADIHFDYRLAVKAAEAGADKIRINPGNLGDSDALKAVVTVCKQRNIPIRVGVNGGSLERRLLEKHGGPTPAALVESALEQVKRLNELYFEDVCISIKSSNVPSTVAAYRLISRDTNCPLHIGITESGTEYAGTIKSAMGIGALLLDGVGDTIRVSLTADPVREIIAGKEILKAAGVRKHGVNLISCPSCGRCNIDLIALAADVEKRVSGINRDITVAVMGCAVNGPGEAREADFGVAGGDGFGVLFMKGRIVGKARQDQLADKLLELIENNTDGN